MFSDRFPSPEKSKPGQRFITQEQRDKLDQIEIVAGLVDLQIWQMSFPDHGGVNDALVYFRPGPLSSADKHYEFNIPFNRSLEVFYGVLKEWCADKSDFISVRAARRPKY